METKQNVFQGTWLPEVLKNILHCSFGVGRLVKNFVEKRKYVFARKVLLDLERVERLRWNQLV